MSGDARTAMMGRPVDLPVLGQADRIYRWEGPKRKQTLFSAKLGRLLLTPSHLIFLSTGKSDVAKRMALGAISPSAGMGTSATEHLDMSALEQEGSLVVPLTQLAGCELKGMFKVLTITYRDESGQEAASTFAPKNGGMPEGPGWVEAAIAARDALNGQQPPLPSG